MKIQFSLLNLIDQRKRDHGRRHLRDSTVHSYGSNCCKFLFNIIRIRKAILGEVLDMTPRKEHTVELTCME